MENPVKPPELLLGDRPAEDLGVELGDRSAELPPVLVGVDAAAAGRGERLVAGRDHKRQVVEQRAVPVPDKMRSSHGEHCSRRV